GEEAGEEGRPRCVRHVAILREWRPAVEVVVPATDRRWSFDCASSIRCRASGRYKEGCAFGCTGTFNPHPASPCPRKGRGGRQRCLCAHSLRRRLLLLPFSREGPGEG